MTLQQMHVLHEEERTRKVMQDLAAFLDHFLNGDAQGEQRATGFILLTFPFGPEPGKRANWITNGASRDEIIKLMRECCNRLDPKVT